MTLVDAYGPQILTNKLHASAATPVQHGIDSGNSRTQPAASISWQQGWGLRPCADVETAADAMTYCGSGLSFGTFSPFVCLYASRFQINTAVHHRPFGRPLLELYSAPLLRVDLPSPEQRRSSRFRQHASRCTQFPLSQAHYLRTCPQTIVKCEYTLPTIVIV